MAELTGLSVLIEGDASSLKASIASAVGMVDKFKKSAEDSAKVFERAFSKSDRSLDRLRRSLDPLYASSKRYESAVETLDQALKFGSITQQQHTQLLERAGKTYLTAGKEAGTAAVVSGRFGEVMQKNGWRINQAAMQLGDFAIQMQAGTRWTTAFAQQGSQLALLIPGIGAAIGSLAAIGLPLLISAFSAAAGKGKTLDDIMGDLNASAGDLDSTLRDVLTPFAELQKQFGENAAKARELYDAMYAMRQLQFAEALAAANTALTESLGGVTEAMRRFNEVTLSTNAALHDDAVVVAQQVVRGLNDEFGVTVIQAKLIADALDAMSNARGPDEVAAAARQLREALMGAADETGKLPPKLLEAAIQAGQIEQKAAALATAMGRSADAARALAETDMATPIGLAAFQAESLANSLGLAVSRLYGLQKIVRGSGGTIGGGAPSKLSPNTPGWGAGRGGTGGSGGWGTAPGWTVSKPASGGGGGGGQNPLQGELAQLQTALATAEELEMQSWLKRQEILQQALDQRMITQAEYAALMEEAQRQHQGKMAAIDSIRYGDGAQQLAGYLSSTAQIFQAGNEKMVKTGQALAAASALISTYQGAAEELKKGTFGFASAAAVMAKGMALVSAIKGVSTSGGGGGGATAAAVAAPQQPGTFINVSLAGNGYVPAAQVRGLISQINQEIRNGGRIVGIRAG